MVKFKLLILSLLFINIFVSIFVSIFDLINKEYFNDFQNCYCFFNEEKMIGTTLDISKVYKNTNKNGTGSFIIEGYLNEEQIERKITVGKSSYLINFEKDKILVNLCPYSSDIFLVDINKNYLYWIYFGTIFKIYSKISIFLIIILIFFLKK